MEQNQSLEDFKIKVKQWLTIDEEINKYESKIKELKKHKKKVLEPEITSFMIEHNITNLNTENGLIKCNERKTKKGLNKHNIRENLGQVLNDESQIEQALQLIMNNREIVVKHVLTKPKMKGKSLDT
ncbi:MAG: hypothetical protein CMK44_01245 [Porticoccus sp.]|nr:hypothetical protein [Porticoccus sp.]|tara:strand:- start:833 stop:1213 length:381 start_codon:yes stop_codon:yes gene_type:complete